MSIEQIGMILTVLANVGFVGSFLISYIKSRRKAGERMAKHEFMLKILWAYHSKHHMGGDLSNIDLLDTGSQTSGD